MPKRKNMHRDLEALPLGYFLTLRTYGTWLHGDDRGSVDARHDQFNTPYAAPDPQKRATAEARMTDESYLLAAESAALVERAVVEVCSHRCWDLRAAKARTNHVHIVVIAALTPERMMNDFKGWITRRLRENKFAGPDQTAWAAHGSTPYLWCEEQLLGAIDYVKNWQGGPLQKTWQQLQDELARKKQNA